MSKQETGWLKLPQEGGMRVPGWVVTHPSLAGQLDESAALQQVRNVATLEGIVEASIAMADLHWGYGFPIGGVAAFDAHHGLISPGGVGYDINCGVRLAIAPVRWSAVSPKQREALLKSLARRIGSGPGSEGPLELSDDQLDQVLTQGARWAVAQGWGVERDLEHCEEGGCMADADPSAISMLARNRGRKQLGTIGSGNHFVEIGEVSHCFLPEIAGAWGVEEGMLYVLIHTGSRGLGHQTCQDALDQLAKAGYGEGLVDLQLMSVPIDRPEGRHYWRAMNAAANFAFANRQCVLHAVRQILAHELALEPFSIQLVYDVCHNMAKRETHRVHGEAQELIVHRKGATRAFGPGHPDLPEPFRATGQPVLVPGDMERASFLMRGEGNARSWCSACHGAGRALSRHKAAALFAATSPIEQMRQRGILVASPSAKAVAEEMPEAYKNVVDVVAATEAAGLATRVARLQPSLVLKG
jgi:tRNA-splicing ligase RtcB